MKKRALFLAAVLLGAMTGCGATTSETITAPQIEQYRIVRIAVLPFMVSPPTPGQERGYAAPAPPAVAGDKLADVFYLKLNTREGLAVVPPQMVRDAMPSITASVASRSVLRDLGERLDVGAVLEGTVRVYRERKGSAIGLEQPRDAAAVGFSVRLVSVKDGKTLWTGEYYERQRPLTEDLSGFLERGVRFLTVEQLANSAVNHVLREFPLGRQLQRMQGEMSPSP
jgi:TolB-like protein